MRTSGHIENLPFLQLRLSTPSCCLYVNIGGTLAQQAVLLSFLLAPTAGLLFIGTLIQFDVTCQTLLDRIFL